MILISGSIRPIAKQPPPADSGGNKGKPKPSSNLDKSTNSHHLTNSTARKNEPLYKDVIFTPDVYVRENNTKTEFTPSGM